MAENFPIMGKEIATQLQEAQRVPYRINPKKNTPRHILIRLTKIKHKEQILKASREKQKITWGDPYKVNSWSVNKNSAGQREYLKWLKRKIYNQDYSTQQGSHSDLKEKSKALQTSKS